MTKLKLVIGNKNYSSWSLRPWLVLRQIGVPFDEEIISLYEAGTRARILERSPSGRVPVLHDGTFRVWESPAICEYLAESFPEAKLWPENKQARAVARAISHEMHAGFSALRTHLPMNVRKRFAAPPDDAGVKTDIARIEDLWQSTRERYGSGGDFLFGTFTVADAMYAPVAFRFQSYNVTLRDSSKRYRDTLLALPAMREWAEVAAKETWTIAGFEK